MNVQSEFTMSLGVCPRRWWRLPDPHADCTHEVRLTARPDIRVLLTDVMMPGASGPELTRELIADRPELKVIYMSGYTEDTIVNHGVLLPGIAFLSKPFTAENLGRKIRSVLVV